MPQLTNISLALVLSSNVLLAGCGVADRPSLTCAISHLGPRESSTSPASEIEREIAATLSNRSKEGVWDFSGKLRSIGDDTRASEVSGSFYQYDNGTFELVASAGNEQLVVMPENSILQERGLQGVRFQEGGHVSTGTPLNASCNTSIPESS